MLLYFVLYVALTKIWWCQNYAIFGVVFSASKSGCVVKITFFKSDHIVEFANEGKHLKIGTDPTRYSLTDFFFFFK